MTSPERSSDDVTLADLLQPIVRQRRLIWQTTLGIVGLALLIGFVFILWQPVRKSASIGFRPIFAGAAEGTYPNGLPFGGTDIVDHAVLDRVYASNQLQEYCELGPFRASFTLQQNSPQLQFLNLEYLARLSDTNLTAVERQQIQNEYESRRSALPRDYELVFIALPHCDRIPEDVVKKTLVETLSTWADDAVERRGVLKFQVPMLTPEIFDHPTASAESVLVKADLLRTSIARVIENIRRVEELPGSALVRVGDKKRSLAEVRAELEDLTQARLNPLMDQAARSLGAESRQWLEQALRVSQIQYQAAEQRAEAYRGALREYLRIASPSTLAPNTTPFPSQPSNQQMMPLIDRSFIDRLMEMSAENTAFRQQITREAIDASVAAVELGAVAEKYRQLLAASGGSRTGGLSPSAVEAVLAEITEQAKRATATFNQIYEEVSNASLRSAPAMYRIEQAPTLTELRSFGFRDLAFLEMALLLTLPILLALALLVQHHARRLVRNGQR